MAFTNDREAAQCKLLGIIQYGNGIGDNNHPTDATVPRTHVAVQLKTSKTGNINLHVVTPRTFTPSHLVSKMNTYLSQVFVLSLWKPKKRIAVHYIATTRKQRRLLFQRAVEHCIFFTAYCKRPNVIQSMSAPSGREISLIGSDFKRAGIVPVTTDAARTILRTVRGTKIRK